MPRAKLPPDQLRRSRTFTVDDREYNELCGILQSLRMGRVVLYLGVDKRASRGRDFTVFVSDGKITGFEETT